MIESDNTASSWNQTIHSFRENCVIKHWFKKNYMTYLKLSLYTSDGRREGEGAVSYNLSIFVNLFMSIFIDS